MANEIDIMKRRTTNERIYVAQDANWNVTALVGTDGRVKERFLYTSYGERTVLDANWAGTSDAYGFLYGHQDGRQDSATGLIHFQARDYNPTLGRWMQQDPAGYVDGMSLYQFVQGRPINQVDPTGLLAGAVGPVNRLSYIKKMTPAKMQQLIQTVRKVYPSASVDVIRQLAQAYTEKQINASLNATSVSFGAVKPNAGDPMAQTAAAVIDAIGQANENAGSNGGVELNSAGGPPLYPPFSTTPYPILRPYTGGSLDGNQSLCDTPCDSPFGAGTPKGMGVGKNIKRFMYSIGYLGTYPEEMGLGLANGIGQVVMVAIEVPFAPVRWFDEYQRSHSGWGRPILSDPNTNNYVETHSFPSIFQHACNLGYKAMSHDRQELLEHIAEGN